MSCIPHPPCAISGFEIGLPLWVTALPPQGEDAHEDEHDDDEHDEVGGASQPVYQHVHKRDDETTAVEEGEGVVGDVDGDDDDDAQALAGAQAARTAHASLSGVETTRGTTTSSAPGVTPGGADSAGLIDATSDGRRVADRPDPPPRPHFVTLERPLVPPRALALVVGSEARGVSAQMYAAADCFVTLPMFGLVESLNVHTATALCLQRVLDLMADAGYDIRGSLSEEECAALRAQWRRRLLRK